MSLITNISQFRSASTISIGNTLANWQPYIDEAEDTFIRPVIGDDLFDVLEKSLESSASGESKYDILITCLRKAIALYALWLGIDEASVSISAAGAQIIESETHKQAPQYKIRNIRESWISRAHRQVDLSLKYIEKNKKDFSLYVSRDNDLFINTASEFQKYVDIRESRRVFIALRPVMRSVEKKYIKATLGEELYGEVKNAINASGSEISKTWLDLLDLIKPAIAHLTIARALMEIGIEYLDWGVFESGGSTFDNVVSKQVANQDRISVMIGVNQHDGDSEIKELQEFLDKNSSATLYASYYESALYQGKDYAEKKNNFENTADKGIFVT